MIQVEQGLILSLQFTAFDIEEPGYDYDYDTYEYDDSLTCYDHLTITDGDGTTLMEKSCGSTSDGNILIGDQSIGSSLPANITSTSNIVKLVFSTSSSTTRPGWSISWMAVTPGECQQYVWIFDDLSNFFLSIIVDDLTTFWTQAFLLFCFTFHSSFTHHFTENSLEYA